MRKPFAALATLAASSLVLAACAMPADDPNFQSGSGIGGDAEAAAEANAAGTASLDALTAAPTGIGVDVALAAAPKKGAVIVSITDGSEYEGVSEKAMAAAAEALGWTFTSVTADPADPTAVAAAFDKALETKASGIHFYGEFYDSVSVSLASAESAGIPVICTGCTGEPGGGLTDTSINGTAENNSWADAMASYVTTNQWTGEAAGVQIFVAPGGAINDFNIQFDTSLVNQCRECSTMQSMFDPTVTDLADPAAVATFIAGEMGTSLGSWAMIDSGAYSTGVAEALTTDPTLLAPVTLLGRGASAADIEALKALGGAAPAADPAATSRTAEQAAALQAWVAIPLPVMGWRVIDQFARILGGDALANGPLPAQFLTGGNVAEAALDAEGNFLGVADYESQFLALWGIK